MTPRTPGAAAAHYFDDIWTSKGKPKKPHHLRRSSTSRSIGFRTDNWDKTSHDDEEPERGGLNRTNSVGYLNEEALKQKQEMDSHVANYVSDQLSRIKSGESDDLDGGEFEATLDGSFDRGRDRRRNGKGRGDRDDYFSK